MTRSLTLALCAALFAGACATVPESKTVEVQEVPRWISGELVINFTTNPIEVNLCVGGHQCNVPTQLFGRLQLTERLKDGTSTLLLYRIPSERAVRYDEIHLVPKQEPNGFTHWLVYAVSRNFGNVGCNRYFLATPAQEEGGDIRPEGNHFQVVEVQPEHEEGCGSKL